MFSELELIIIASFLGITASRTTLLERIKVWLTEHNVLLIVKALDCSLCSSFWSAIILNLVFFSTIHNLIVNVCASALLGYFIGKD